MSTNKDKTKSAPVVCYVAGRSGGHIIPCLTMARETRNKKPDTNILFFSTEQPLDIELISAHPNVTWHIPLPLQTASIRGLFGFFAFIWQLLITSVKSLYYLIKHRPKKVVCTGGFLAIPVTICARLLAIHVQWYELNVIPGKATKWISRLRMEVLTTFNETQAYLPKKAHCVKTTYPIRFFQAPQLSKKEALAKLFLDSTRQTILVLGGSQGSLFINQMIKRWLVEHVWVHSQIQIIHQTGRHDNTNWVDFYTQHKIPAVVCSFSHELELFYAASDLIISRAGAGTLFETLFFSMPSLIIPLETTDNNHQVANAIAMHTEYDEIFTVLRQEALMHNPDILHNKIMQLLPLHHSSEPSLKQPTL